VWGRKENTNTDGEELINLLRLIRSKKHIVEISKQKGK